VTLWRPDDGDYEGLDSLHMNFAEVEAYGAPGDVVEVTHKLHSDDKYCNDYGAGGSGDY